MRKHPLSLPISRVPHCMIEWHCLKQLLALPPAALGIAASSPTRPLTLTLALSAGGYTTARQTRCGQLPSPKTMVRAGQSTPCLPFVFHCCPVNLSFLIPSFTGQKCLLYVHGITVYSCQTMASIPSSQSCPCTMLRNIVCKKYYDDC